MSGITMLQTLLSGTEELYTTTLSGSDTLAYNGFALCAEISNMYNNPSEDFLTYDTIRSNGEGYDMKTYRSKVYTLNGNIIGDDTADMESDIITLKKSLNQQGKLFERKLQDGTIICSYAYPRIEFDWRFRNRIHAPSAIDIVVLDPFMYDATLQETSFTGKTASFSDTVTISDGDRGPSPFILIDFKSGTSGVTSVSAGVSDIVINVTGTFSNGDLLLINSKGKYVNLNGSELLTYTGEFPVLELGANTFDFTSNGTINADVYVIHYPTYD